MNRNDDDFEDEEGSAKNRDDLEPKPDFLVTGAILGANLGTAGSGMGFGGPLAAAGTARVLAKEDAEAKKGAADNSSEGDSAGVSEAQREVEADELNG